MAGITYKKSGVDIAAMEQFKRGLRSVVKKSFRPEVLKNIGGFGSFFAFNKNAYKNPILVSSADGVGTKLKIAALANKHDTIGIDAVAMNVNDILCVGAVPLFFLDYIAFSKVAPRVLSQVVGGITEGCVQSGCALIGGETAQMPDIYRDGEYDVAGFCVGAVEKDRIIDGSGIKPGDVVIGLESNGLHSNGFSLVRKVLSERELKNHSAELLKPTRIYVKPILSLLSTIDYRLSTIKGISHITGGAFYDKIARILPDNLDVVIRKGSWPVPEIFRMIQEKGAIADYEMYHTLNMGIGMVLIVRVGAAEAVVRKLASLRLKSGIIGTVVKGSRKVQLI